MKFNWLDSARAELRAIDGETAVRILHALTDYADSGTGDVKALAGAGKAAFGFELQITG